MLKWVVLSGLALMILYSCQHEPFILVDNTPIDTTGIDTTGIDTTGTDTTGIACDPDTAYFQNDVLPIIISNCAKSGCHDEASAEEDVILTTYEYIMSTADVDPYDPMGSKLYKVLLEDDPEDRMPPAPNQALESEQIALIYKWILQGALNNYCGGECDTSNVTFSATIEPTINTFCVGCHNGPGGFGQVDLSNYGSIYTVVVDGRLQGSVNGWSGYTKMPLTGSLSDCQIQQINLWIEDGAPNN